MRKLLIAFSTAKSFRVVTCNLDRGYRTRIVELWAERLRPASHTSDPTADSAHARPEHISLSSNILRASYLDPIICRGQRRPASHNSNELNILRTRREKHSSLNIPFCATNSLECNILPLNYLDSIICRQAPESVSRNPNHSNILRKRSEKNRRAVLLSGAARSKATCSEVEASLRLHGPSHQQESFSAPLRPTQAKAPTRADPTAPERMRRTGTPK